MSERKSTYDIGTFEGKRGQISVSDTIVEDDDNKLEEAEPGSSQQHTNTGRCIGEIEEKVESIAPESSLMNALIAHNLEEAEPGSSQQHTNTGICMGEIEEEVESIAPESSLTNALIGTGPSTSETVERSYASDSKIRDIEQVESMERELKLIYAFLKYVEAIEEPDARLRFWEETMRGIAQEAEAFIGPYKQNVRVEEKGFCNRLASTVKNLKADSKVVKKITKIRKKIQKFTERRIEYGIEHVEAFNSTSHKLYQNWPPSQYSEESDIIGFEDHEYEITERLLTVDEPHRCIILVVGMEGSGKTNLAKSVYDKNKVHFRTHAWVPISGKGSAVEILQDIRKKVIGSDQEPKGKRFLKEELKQMLQNFFREKRYLIVLDNIPKAGVWDDLKDTFPDESNGSRIVITTRDMAIASHSDSRIFPYKLHLRSIDESWTLFTDTLKNEVPKELEKLGKEIVMSCGGLPLTIVNKGELLSKKAATIDEWSRVLKELKEETGPWLDISEKVSGDLPIELKGCLYYFLLFPEDFEIPTRRLITLWVAEGYMRLGRGDKSPEHFAERYLMELIDRNLVQVTEKKPNGKVRTCRLPGALRKLLSKAMEDKISKGQGKTASSIQWNRWIVDHHNYTDASNTSYNHIHGDNIDTATLQASYEKSLSFMSFDYREGSQPREEIGNFLDRCISYRCFLLLRVLDLERVFRPQLPKVLRKLTLLRYLGLRWTYLESLPSSISNLLKLQTLDVKHTYISTLPPSIWNMQHLRHLYLSETYRSRFEPRPSGASLTDLQTLWGVFVDEKSPVNDGLDTLINLRKLGVACRYMSNQKDVMSLKLQAVANWIKKLEHLQSLRLKSHDENNQPWDLHIKPLSGHTNLSSVYFLGRLETPSIISEFPENLIELTLSASALTEDPLQKLGKLPKLRILRLFSKSYVGTNMCCPQSSFPQLRVLKLWKLEELEDWIVEEGALSRLRDLEIRSCASLHKLPDGLQHVKTLQELKISNMPMDFTERTKDSNSEDWFKIEHVRYVRTEP
ncbi:hypothetical protein CMV_013582 [Castanea mollissima]|uniref:NB-ARC domain-containing protein n=1 Tax=Castanea mollissima TaxID=60419 RepID=A0A8J4RCU0_9ROSI|nr:hypothetical protein CMV_013582 [Castanea mollissima]